MDEFTSFIVKYASARLRIREEYCIRVNSNVPVASGLKSNSAVAVGVTYALAEASKAELLFLLHNFQPPKTRKESFSGFFF